MTPLAAVRIALPAAVSVLVPVDIVAAFTAPAAEVRFEGVLLVLDFVAISCRSDGRGGPRGYPLLSCYVELAARACGGDCLIGSCTMRPLRFGPVQSGKCCTANAPSMVGFQQGS